MVSKAWFRIVRRGTPGPVALAATAVMLTAGAGALVPTAAVTDPASATSASTTSAPVTSTSLTRTSVVTPLAASTLAASTPAAKTPAAKTPAAKAPDKKGGGKGGGAAAPAKSGSPCSAAAKACVDLAKQQAWLTDGAGHVTYGPVPARGGAKGAKTPKGSFSVIWKDQNHLSKEFNNAPMPYSVFFYPGDAFHGGNPNTASNGCVHLNIGAAQRFFSSLSPGDKVEIK